LRLDAASALRAVVLPSARDTISPGRHDKSAQLWPHIHGSDAMFLALLKRVA